MARKVAALTIEVLFTRHYKEPVMAATSSFTEGASVFGGQANLVQAIDNIFTIYEPDVIAVHTTCLSETIGDDIPQIARKAEADGKIPKGKYVIHVNTPSYVGTHVTGFAGMTKAMVDYFAQSTGKKIDQINIIPGYVEPSDMEEIKRIAEMMGVRTVVFPDTSRVLNRPQTGKYEMFPKGGVTVEALISTGDSLATIALGKMASGLAARALDTKCKVPCEILDLPIGFKATDRFVDTLQENRGNQCSRQAQRGPRPVDGYHYRYASVFLREEGGSGGRSRPAHRFNRIPRLHRHVADTYRYRHRWQGIRSSNPRDHT